MKIALFVSGAAACICPQAAIADSVEMTSSQLFAVAQGKIAQNRIDDAITIYAALERDPDLDVRCEARYRHGQLLENLRRFADAAVLFRAILDEKPAARRVRLELAKALGFLGHDDAARRELRQVQAGGGLPPEVVRIVDQYSAALRLNKPFGGSFELGLAPSSNINRATSSPTLNSILGPLALSDDARARSGLGLNANALGTVQIPVSPKMRLTAQLSSLNSLYQDSSFDDTIVAGSLGVNALVGDSRVRVSAGPAYRLYGGHAYSTAANSSVDAQFPLGKQSEIELESDFSLIKYRRNNLQNGNVYGETLSFDHAYSARLGSKLSLFGQRATANDPGYATWSGGGSLLIWREFGKTTMFATGSASHLASDARFFLYTDKRKEWLYRAGWGATFRQLKVWGFAPTLRVNYENNRSTIEVYTYRRVSGEMAFSRAF